MVVGEDIDIRSAESTHTYTHTHTHLHHAGLKDEVAVAHDNAQKRGAHAPLHVHCGGG